MQHILNVSAIKKRMNDKPDGQRLHLFFAGMTDTLTVKQIKEVRRIINSETKKTTRFLDSIVKSAPKEKKKAA